MSGQDFLNFLNFLNKKPYLEGIAHHHFKQVRIILDRLAFNGTLIDMGNPGDGVMIPKSYHCLPMESPLRANGSLWMAQALGGRLIHHEVSPAVVQIVGTNADDDPCGGSGLVFDRHHILTCRHVVGDMNVAERQRFQGSEFRIDPKNIFQSEAEDIAVLRVDGNLNPVQGLVFLAPEIAKKVYTFGYPRVPNVRPRTRGSDDAHLVIQSGEVTNQRVVASNRAELFLYSAISRPGDSGGPIVSDEGYVVGMTTNLTEGTYECESVFSPHYAGVPADVIAKAVSDMGIGVEICYETF